MQNVLELDLENTIFFGGKLEEENGADIVSWMFESYYRQKEEIAECSSLEKEIKKIARQSKKQNEEPVTKKKETKLSKPMITMVINSPGGNYDEMIAIYDAMQILDADFRVIVLGSAMSAGALLTLGGTKGLRYITKNSRLMFHAISTALEGKSQDLQIDYHEANRLNEQMGEIIVTHSNIDRSIVDKYINRDLYILPEQALELGIVDHIIEKII